MIQTQEQIKTQKVSYVSWYHDPQGFTDMTFQILDMGNHPEYMTSKLSAFDSRMEKLSNLKILEFPFQY